MKLLTIVGARPQFIKAATVSRCLQTAISRGASVDETIIHTGQHFDANMSDVFFTQMNIPRPEITLGISGGRHGQMTGAMISSLEDVFYEKRPDGVLLYGDTNSTLAGAIAASKIGIPIFHVEAGLRSFNTLMPEEINRILVDRLSSKLFCPTSAAIKNLDAEGVSDWRPAVSCELSGDVMFDGVLHYRERAQRPTEITMDHGFVLCTIHRAENTDNAGKLTQIFTGLNEIAAELPVVCPLHPRTKKQLGASITNFKNITFCKPVGYLEMMWLLDRCQSIVTDSGGLQKEAFFFGKQCLTIRDESEWVELLTVGVNSLCDASAESITDQLDKLKTDRFDPTDFNLYGNGQAAESIVKSLLS